MIIESILKINPNAEVTVRGSDINTCEIEWHNGTTPIPKADIEAKMVEVQAEYDANQYQRDRVYPQLGEQFDKLWHDINNGTLDNTGEFFTALKEVKDNNPKPGA